MLKEGVRAAGRAKLQKKVSTSSSQIKQDTMGANFASKAFHKPTPQSWGGAGGRTMCPSRSCLTWPHVRKFNSFVTCWFLQHLIIHHFSGAFYYLFYTKPEQSIELYILLKYTLDFLNCSRWLWLSVSDGTTLILSENHQVSQRHSDTMKMSVVWKV